MAFYKIGSLLPHGAPVLRQATLANSITTGYGDVLRLASGFAALGTAGTLVFGNLMNHKSRNDTGLNSTGAASAEFGSYVGTFLTASNNQTVGFIQAEVDISKFSLYSAEESAAIGTTTGSNLPGFFQDITDKDTLNESSAAATAAQYFGWGVDPENTAQAVVNIYESQVFGI